jgi:hypothetical protein
MQSFRVDGEQVSIYSFFIWLLNKTTGIGSPKKIFMGCGRFWFLGEGKTALKPEKSGTL